MDVLAALGRLAVGLCIYVGCRLGGRNNDSILGITSKYFSTFSFYSWCKFLLLASLSYIAPHTPVANAYVR